MAKTILLADDSITIQKIVNLTFSGEGIDVVTVGNGDAAIKKVYDIHPDLVLADIFMPGKNGYEVCEYIKGQPEVQHTPVILLVGAFEPFDSNEAARVKADGHLTKPFEIKVLISAVNSLISAAEEDKVEAIAQQRLDTQTESLSASIAMDSSPRTEAETPVLMVQHTAMSESAGSELQSGLSSPTLTSAFFAGEPLSTEPSGVDVDEDVDHAAELSPFEDPLDTAQGEEQIPMRASVGVEDFDPLGLYASEPITAVGLEEAAEAILNSKELVVDIWESRSSPSSQLEVLPEVAEHRVQVPAARTTIAFQQPVRLESAVKMSQSVPIDLLDQRATILAPSEPVLSSPVSLDPGPNPLAGDRAQAKQPAISAEATDSSELVNIVVQRVMEKLSREVIEKIAWEVVPDLAEIIIKEQVETHFKASGRI